MLSALALGAVFVLILANFDVLIGSSGPSVLSWVLPAIAIVPGAAGLWWGHRLKIKSPAVYAYIGHGGEGGVVVGDDLAVDLEQEAIGALDRLRGRRCQRRSVGHSDRTG